MNAAMLRAGIDHGSVACRARSGLCGWASSRSYERGFIQSTSQSRDGGDTSCSHARSGPVYVSLLYSRSGRCFGGSPTHSKSGAR
jgi:hypothetical protein